MNERPREGYKAGGTEALFTSLTEEGKGQESAMGKGPKPGDSTQMRWRERVQPRRLACRAGEWWEAALRGSTML